jgi:hypothetical protein
MDKLMITPSPEFTPAELQAMHRWCLKYRDRVRNGDVPGSDDDELFLDLSAITYEYLLMGGASCLK